MHALWLGMFLCCCFCLHVGASPSCPESKVSHMEYLEMHEFLDKMLSPDGCEESVGIEYVWSDMGCGGGFAAHFQLAAAQWLRAAAMTEYKVPVIIKGNILKYSEGEQCKHVNGDWTCFFLPMSTCQDKLLKDGKQIQVDINKSGPFDDNLIPKQFRHVGIAYWWGLVQERMFRLQPKVLEYVTTEALRIAGDKGVFGHKNASLSQGSEKTHSYERNQLDWKWHLEKETTHAAGGDIDTRGLSHEYKSIAGLHVRHGDKHVDGFHHYSLAAHVHAIKGSCDCQVSKPAKLLRARRRRAMTVGSVERGADAAVATNASMLVGESILPGHRAGARRVSAMECWSDINKPQGGYVIPVFVASDDEKVLAAASRQSFLTALGYTGPGASAASKTISGVGGAGTDVSTTTHANGMLNTLMASPELGHQASLEIIRDITLLSHCTTIVGVAASQIFRMAVGIATARRRLVHAVALDHKQIPKIKRMSAQYGLPIVEDFRFTEEETTDS